MLVVAVAVAVALALGVFAIPSASTAMGGGPGLPCGHLCEEGGRIRFEHPTWGPSELIVAFNRSAASCDFFVVDRAGTYRWEYRSQNDLACSVAYPAIATPDAAGNLLIGYSSGRYPGVTVLRPVADGMDDLGTLPDTPRFGDSGTLDVDGDGAYEIVSILRPCDPDCATGLAYFRTYSWNGDDYFTELCTEPRLPPVPIQATPGPGGTLVGTLPPGTCGAQSNVSQIVADTEWFAVYFDGRSGWAPAISFQPPSSTAPWVAHPYDGIVPTTVPPPPPLAPEVPAQCADYSFNDQYPIRRCDEGYAVYLVQTFLRGEGYAVDPDGYFGPGTEVAVRYFQASRGLEVDGLVGRNTWLRLSGGGMAGYDLDNNGVIDPDEVVFD